MATPYMADPFEDDAFGAGAAPPASSATAVNPRDAMIARDLEAWRNRLRGVAQGLNFTDAERAAEEELGGVERQASYAQNAGQDPDAFLREAEARLRQRSAPRPGSETNVPGGGAAIPALPSAVPDPAAASAGAAIQPDSEIGNLFRYLQQRDQAAAQERASMRNVLLSQLGEATRPVSAQDPTLQAILGPQRVELQRAAERQRSQAVARLAAENLEDSGTLDTMLSAIEQQLGEASAAATGRVLGQELSARRDQVARLLSLAVQSGDSEAARTLQGQLNLLEQQIGREAGLNQLGYNYSALQSQLAQAMLPYQYAPMASLYGLT